jgi:RIO-like serine/threonine protein kinase
MVSGESRVARGVEAGYSRGIMAVKDISDALVCQAYERFADDKSRWPYELLQQWTGHPFKVCYRAMERADRHGLIEWGVSLRAGWLTQSGLDLLALDRRLNGTAAVDAQSITAALDGEDTP